MVSIAVHGGAWDIPDNLVELHRFGVQKAITVGMAVLNDGGSAVDAVEAAIMIMEDDDTFNAGTGAFLNAAGEIELDASIMDGKTINAGAIAAVQHIKNPIMLARKIMEESDHVLLVGIGAVRFAKEHGVRTCKQDELITEKEIERWREWQRKPPSFTKEAYQKKIFRPILWELLRLIALVILPRAHQRADCRINFRDAWGTRPLSVRARTLTIA